MRDTVLMERQGIPSVGLVNGPFEKIARLQVRQLGMPDAPLLIYPQDQPSQDPPEVVAAKAERVARTFPQLILTSSPEPVVLA